jgi:hypothetical protein
MALVKSQARFSFKEELEISSIIFMLILVILALIKAVNRRSLYLSMKKAAFGSHLSGLSDVIESME